LAGALNESEDATSKLSHTGGVSRYLKGFNVRLSLHVETPCPAIR
jgi:hypothetical protein